MTPSKRQRAGISAPTPARAAASRALRLVQEQRMWASEAIQSHVERADLSLDDKRFASALILGVVQTEGTLDQVLDGFLAHPQKVRPDVRRALQIAAYELLFMGHEAHDAVDQGVRLVGTSAPFAKGMANAVLRKAAKAASDFPFGDPDAELEAFCTQHGFPLALGQALATERGEPCARRLIEEARIRPPVFLQLNALVAGDASTLRFLEDAGIAFVEVTDVLGCIMLKRSADVASAPIRRAIAEGAIIVSDLGAQVVAHLAVRDGLPASLLEVGAGRGTKTVLIQSMAARAFEGRISPYVCVDSSSEQTRSLHERIRLCHASVDEVLVHDGRDLASVLPPQAFAMVFVDAPCSGVGTLRRHPEIRWRWSEEETASLVQTQRAMLASASGQVTQKGSLIYATCSLMRAEDEAVVEHFLASDDGIGFAWDSGLVTVGCGFGADRHFAARLTRDS